jgi:IS5 family transposase
MVGLTCLGHAYQLSGEEVVRRWVENPYYQYFCGEESFRYELPVDPSSLSRWRRRIGGQGAELILKLTVPAGLKTKTVQPSSLELVIFDTTVQEKAVAVPTDSQLYNRSRVRLVKPALTYGIGLRQTCSRLGPRAVLKVGRYHHTWV